MLTSKLVIIKPLISTSVNPSKSSSLVAVIIATPVFPLKSKLGRLIDSSGIVTPPVTSHFKICPELVILVGVQLALVDVVSMVIFNVFDDVVTFCTLLGPLSFPCASNAVT